MASIIITSIELTNNYRMISNYVQLLNATSTLTEREVLENRGKRSKNLCTPLPLPFIVDRNLLLVTRGKCKEKIFWLQGYNLLIKNEWNGTNFASWSLKPRLSIIRVTGKMPGKGFYTFTRSRGGLENIFHRQKRTPALLKYWFV